LQGWKFRQQVPIGPYRADFVCPKAKLIVEVDGNHHDDQRRIDAKRTAYLEREGYRVIRFWNNDVLARTESVLDAILAALAPPLPAASRLSLPPEGEGER
jgi:adenine-specific DNA-methyltransferase